ncbi:MAG: methyltransferase [Chitinophagaceae bacterium]|nr:methyltransferase [Chitinophagaceae bacterium]
MPNTYFRFKEFTVHQDKCSMKVCTDACIFGAWVAEKVSGGRLPVTYCLDIGTGTGLLSLLFAQKNSNTIIDAVEIEENAYEQAKENFLNSKWNNRLQIFYTDVKNFIPGKKYDLVICNPPFYEKELLSNEKNKNIAKHDEGLMLKDLIAVIKKHLTKTGYFALLLPYQRIKYFEELAEENNFFLREKLLIRQTPSHNFFRGILFFGNNKEAIKINELIIKNDDGNYTEAFTDLLKEYYLKL